MIYKYKRDNEFSESHVAQCSKVGAIWLISKFANIFTKEMASLNREELAVIVKLKATQQVWGKR